MDFKLIATPVGGTSIMGLATILNDDTAISVSNDTATEGGTLDPVARRASSTGRTGRTGRRLRHRLRTRRQSVCRQRSRRAPCTAMTRQGIRCPPPARRARCLSRQAAGVVTLCAGHRFRPRRIPVRRQPVAPTPSCATTRSHGCLGWHVGGAGSSGGLDARGPALRGGDVYVTTSARLGTLARVCLGAAFRCHDGTTGGRFWPGDAVFIAPAAAAA